MKISSEKINLTFSVIFLGIACFTFNFLNSKIQNDNTLAKQNNVLWQQEMLKKNQMQSIQNGLKNIQDERAIFDKYFVSNSDLVPFLDNMEDLGNKSGAKVETTSVDLSNDNLSLVVGVKAVGSFSAVYKFLLLVENSPYELDVTSMDFQREAPESVVAVPTWNTTFRLKLVSFIK